MMSLSSTLFYSFDRLVYVWRGGGELFSCKSCKNYAELQYNFLLRAVFPKELLSLASRSGPPSPPSGLCNSSLYVNFWGCPVVWLAGAK